MKTLIAVPCFDMVHTDFMRSLMALEKPPDTSFTVVKNTLIHVARNVIAGNAVKAGFDRVMWFDSDMSFPPDTLLKLSADMDQGMEFVTGLYFTRSKEIKPVIYSELWWEKTEKGVDVGAGSAYDYPEGIMEIAGAGFGCCLTSVDLIRRVGDRFGSPFNPLQGFGEDLSFCHRVIQIGGKMYADTSVKCGHVGQFVYDESFYLKERTEEIERLKTPTAGDNKIPLKW